MFDSIIDLIENTLLTYQNVFGHGTSSSLPTWVIKIELELPYAGQTRILLRSGFNKIRWNLTWVNPINLVDKLNTR